MKATRQFALRAVGIAVARRETVESAWSVLALLDQLVREDDARQLELVEDNFVPAAGGQRVPLIDEDPSDNGEDDVNAAKLLASEAPAGAEGPHGAGPAGASGRGIGGGR